MQSPCHPDCDPVPPDRPDRSGLSGSSLSPLEGILSTHHRLGGQSNPGDNISQSNPGDNISDLFCGREITELVTDFVKEKHRYSHSDSILKSQSNTGDHISDLLYSI